jgi:Cu+-exporting ATPase
MAEKTEENQKVALEPRTFKVTGMTCNACVNSVERSLNSMPGVSATVNFAAETAHVLAPAEITAKEIIKKISDAGYEGKEIGDNESITLHSKKSALALIFGLIFTIPVAIFSMSMSLQMDFGNWLVEGFKYFNFALPTDSFHQLVDFALIILSAPVVLIVAFPIHRAAIRNFFHPTMDNLISLGSLTAFGWSIYAAFSNLDTSYTEVAASVVTLVILGRYLESRAKRSASSALQELLKISAKDVTVNRGGLPQVISIEDLEIGDVFIVMPGQRIATDGVVVSGASTIDNSLITGESVPVEVAPGDRVIGATINQNGRLEVRATRVGKETEFARITAMVISAQGEKAPIQRMADRISAVFVPIVTTLAIATFVFWRYTNGETTAKSIEIAVAVLVIACPCALGLATPVALLVASGRGAQRGIVLRKPSALETAKRITDVVLDKTGTLTTGQMKVVSATVVPEAASVLGNTWSEVATEQRILESAAAIEAQNNHPIAEAIVRFAKIEKPFAVSDFQITPGAGAAGRVHIKTESATHPAIVLIGSAAAVAHSAMAFHPKIAKAIADNEAAGLSVSVLAWEGVALAVFAVGDSVKPDAQSAISVLNSRDINVWLLTGDHADVAMATAHAVGIHENHVVSEASPEAKIEHIKKLKAEGKQVLMIGDGVNDAAALAAADLSMAMGTGTDTAIATADITLTNPALKSITDALDLSKKTLGTIRGNLIWALFYNVIGIPVAALGLLHPMYGAAAMALSSLFVVTNSLRIK